MHAGGVMENGEDGDGMTDGIDFMCSAVDFRTIDPDGDVHCTNCKKQDPLFVLMIVCIFFFYYFFFTVVAVCQGVPLSCHLDNFAWFWLFILGFGINKS